MTSTATPTSSVQLLARCARPHRLAASGLLGLLVVAMLLPIAGPAAGLHPGQSPSGTP